MPFLVNNIDTELCSVHFLLFQFLYHNTDLTFLTMLRQGI